jgi:hypothetical protein
MIHHGGPILHPGLPIGLAHPGLPIGLAHPGLPIGLVHPGAPIRIGPMGFRPVGAVQHQAGPFGFTVY